MMRLRLLQVSAARFDHTRGTLMPIRYSITIATAVLVALVTLSAPAADSADRPNIILCMADDQGWGDVAYNGHPQLKTPTLDEMAATGLRFNRFYAAAPVCSPTRGSVMTGRHPNRFGCFSWGHTLRPQEVTIAEALRAAGYATGHFGKWHLGPVSADSSVSPGGQGFDTWLSSPNFFELSPKLSRNGVPVKTEGEGSQVIVDAALEFIRGAASRKQPFLAVIWFGSPHGPHMALDEDRALYRDLPEPMQHYLGEITAIDRSVGHLRRELRASGLADNTLLWYTSDNGAQGPGSTGGLSGRKGSLWEGGIRVPAIIEWPARVRSPRTIEVACGSVDIYPTLLALAGAAAPNQVQPLDGISIEPLIAGKMEHRSKPLGFWVYPRPGIGVNSSQLLDELAARLAGNSPSPTTPIQTAADPAKIAEQFSADELPGHAAWIDEDFKLHRVPGKSAIEYSLFNLASDPQEKNNLAAAEPQQVARMKTELEAWQKSVINSLNGGDYASQ